MPRGFDPRPNNPALAQLIHLHADLGGKLLANRAAHRKLTADMKHVEAVILLFDPAYDVRRIAVKRRNKANPWLKKGTVFRNVLTVLKAAERPLTAREIAFRVFALKGIETPAPKALADMINAMFGSLKNHKGKSVVTVGEGMPARWVLSATVT